MVAVMGPSGCGKTTLLNCLSGLDKVDAGRSSSRGRISPGCATASAPTYRARRMGFVFQVFNLLPVLNAVENVELPLLVSGVKPKIAREKAMHALSQGRARKVGNAPAGRALRRPAPARHRRPLDRQRPSHRLGRRADRRARLHHRPGDHRPDDRPQQAQQPDLRDRDPRSRRRRPVRPDRAHDATADRRPGDCWSMRSRSA